MLLIGLAIAPQNEYLAEQFMLLDHKPAEVRKRKLEARVAKVPLGVSLSVDVDRWNLLPYLSRNGVGITTVELIWRRLETLLPDATLADLQTELHQLREFPVLQQPNTVYTGTIHSAKGREFDVVFLPAFEEVHLPNENTEEERRLVFVALTRARHAVHISWARTRKPKWGAAEQREPSRFIKEMGK